MKFLSTVKKVPANLPHGTAVRGFKGTLVDKGERFTAAYVFGAIKGYYRERAVFKGYGLDLWVGAGALLGSAVLSAATNGRSGLADHLERVGDQGVASYLNSMGASWGAKKAGRQVAVLTPGVPASILGAMPIGAAYLDASEIANFSAKR